MNEAKALLRLNYKITQFDALERKLLPAPGLGIIILTTNQGIMTMREAEELNIGGMTLCYIY
ncbi:MAG: 30S ribosomal protein S8 [Candidatus Lokiarchaeota archaeon]|nr:30S ribosomal protein S8 [Candidatus Lokiarchaeota archaeon]MBD3200765.1 30S ribosomal protein S8 [Candidatus Lokiarchaeota archaeon]